MSCVTVDKLLGQPLLHSHSGEDVTSRVGDADTVDGQHASEFSSAVLIETRANILATDPAVVRIAFATDTKRFYIADGTAWYQIVPNGAAVDLEAPDMGYITDSARTGYGDGYVTDKKLSNCLIGGNARDENGAIRVDVTKDPDTLEIYLRNMWNTIIYDLTYAYSDFRHTPLGEQVFVWSGTSIANGINGRPIINEYRVSIGAYPSPKTLFGGRF